MYRKLQCPGEQIETHRTESFRTLEPAEKQAIAKSGDRQTRAGQACAKVAQAQQKAGKKQAKAARRRGKAVAGRLGS